jgi:8-oxo-dGTP diphosphatase
MPVRHYNSGMKAKLYCNYCHGALSICDIEGKERLVCDECKEIYYANPLPVASVIVANDKRELLLVKRAQEPAKDMWCFPIGFAECGESIEDAARRELKEEAGIDGAILRIIDVFSENSDVYGDVLVVTFEGERLSGTEKAGDDAIDCAYFPLTNLPKLAFSSQERALQKFTDLKKETWKMSDSFKTLVQETLEGKEPASGVFLSDELVKVIEENSSRIVNLWLRDISTNPSTKAYRKFNRADMLSTGMLLIDELDSWLKGKKSDNKVEEFGAPLGRLPDGEMVPLEELISAISLLKKHIFGFISSEGIWRGAMDMYRVLELSERLVYFFDRVTYYTAAEYRKNSV